MSQPPLHGSFSRDGARDGQPPPEGGGGRSAAGESGPRWAAVLGMGQLGGSMALAGRGAGLFDAVVGFGRNEESLARARELGLCDRTTTSAADAVAQAELVILSVPLRAIPRVVEEIAPALRPGTLVIDVGSVKGTAVRDIEARLPRTVDFVPCHPLAGTENFGPQAARVDLFVGRRCLLCPTDRTSTSALSRAQALWRGVGAEVITMQAELHDRVMAAVSHLPHVAAYALGAALGGLPPDLAGAARELPTTSLRDTSRVAASSPAMWRDIFLENRQALAPLIDGLVSQLASLQRAISSDDEAGALLTLLEAGRAGRARILPP